MSTQTEITRIQTARNTIRTKLVDLGLATSTSKLDALATAVEGIENRGAVSATVQEGDTYTIPKGYHNGSGTVSGVAGGGNYSLQSKTITPTKSQQNITPDSGYYGLSDVTVSAIPENFQDISGVTATAADVLANKVIITSDGETVAGTMPNNSAVSKTLDATTSNQSYTIPAGYHNGKGAVNISLEEKLATPTKSAQAITPTTGKVLSKVSVAAIPDAYQDVTSVDAVAADVLDGKKIVISDGTVVTGSMPNNGAVSKTLDVTTSNQSYTIPAGYHNGKGAVNISLEEKSATPTKSAQTITPTTGKVLSKVSVAAIPDAYQDVSNVDAVAADVLDGKKIVISDGTVVTGSMANNGAINSTIDGLTLTSVTIPSGYTTGGTVSLTDDIEQALAAI